MINRLLLWDMPEESRIRETRPFGLTRRGRSKVLSFTLLKKILFVLLVLAGVLTAGCITSSQIPPGCGGLQSDEDCAASIASTPTPTGSNLVVKSEQVQATPMPTEAMPTEACSIKTTWKKEQLGSVRVNTVRVNTVWPIEENYNNATTTLCSDGVLVIKAVVETTGEIEILAKNMGNEIITMDMLGSAQSLDAEEKRLYRNGRTYGFILNLRPGRTAGLIVLPATISEFDVIAEYKFQTS